MLNKLAKQDIGEVAELLARYWKERGMPGYDKLWAEGYLTEGRKKEIKSDKFFVYKEHGKIIGTASLVIDVGNVAEIRDMMIKAEYRNKGYGRKILDEIIKIAIRQRVRKIYAVIFPELENMYKSFGFGKEGILKSHFAAGEDLIIMSKFLRF